MLKNVIRITALISLLTVLAACGDTNVFTETPVGTVDPGQVVAVVDGGLTVQLGSGFGSTFSAGTLNIGLTSLAAGGKTSVTATVVDSNGNLYTTPVDVRFSSTCTGQGLATIDTPITTTDGYAITTYTATGCSGTDTITAVATVADTTLSANGTITIQAASAGSIEFISADPATIGIKGSGIVEASTITFKVVDSSGSALANQDVTFSLNTSVGGIAMSTTTDTSNSFGEVSTVVSSGTVSTVVRVTATLNSNSSISTQSDGLVISTGLADQNSFSFAAEYFNVEGWDYDGEIVTLTIHASDHFNNPVPDGTSVYFSAEGGQISPTCTIAAGACSVQWTSSEPRPADGRVTLTATMQGEESFSDNNGNGLLDDGESFIDMPEAFFDYDENGSYNPASALLDRNGNPYYEEFRDFNSSLSYDAADGQYNGVLCNPNNQTIVCSTTKSIDVRKNLILTMSGSFATGSTLGVSTLDLGDTYSGSTTLTVADLRNQPMPYGTTVSITAGDGLTLLSEGNYVINSTNSEGGTTYGISVKVANATTTPSGSSLVNIKITTPKGNVTNFSLNVIWTAPPPPPVV